MFLSDVSRRDVVRKIAINNLGELGVKYKAKASKPLVVKEHPRGKVFNVPLQNLPVVTVTLKSGQQLNVPKVLNDLILSLRNRLDTEGIFRKEGSKMRQNDMKNKLNKGTLLDNECHEIDVAALLKLFLRELPDPLIPNLYQELFLRCVILEEQHRLEALLFACLLLPLEHLATLSYLMHFFNEVEKHSAKNKMTFYNLAVVMAPNILRSSGKENRYRLDKNYMIFELLAQNANMIGVLPQHVIDAIGTVDKNPERKKKRRSGSLTRVFSGFRKIVGSQLDNSAGHKALDSQASLTHSAKKRKIDASGLSDKKKKNLLKKLPDGVLLNKPFTPCKNVEALHLNDNTPRRPFQFVDSKVPSRINGYKDTFQWNSRLLNKDYKVFERVVETEEPVVTPHRDRRWSTFGQITPSRKLRKINSFDSFQYVCRPSLESADRSPAGPVNDDSSTYVRVSKSELEEIKNKVSAIERRLSVELETAEAQAIEARIIPRNELNIENVQTAYEQTLIHTQLLTPSSEHITRRLSKELKVRPNTEQRIIRSPSARKIGSMRRRSRELAKNMQVQMEPLQNATTQMIPRIKSQYQKSGTVSAVTPTKKKLHDAQPSCGFSHTNALGSLDDLDARVRNILSKRSLSFQRTKNVPNRKGYPKVGRSFLKSNKVENNEVNK